MSDTRKRDGEESGKEGSARNAAGEGSLRITARSLAWVLGGVVGVVGVATTVWDSLDHGHGAGPYLLAGAFLIVFLCALDMWSAERTRVRRATRSMRRLTALGDRLEGSVQHLERDPRRVEKDASHGSRHQPEIGRETRTNAAAPGLRGDGGRGLDRPPCPSGLRPAPATAQAEARPPTRGAASTRESTPTLRPGRGPAVAQDGDAPEAPGEPFGAALPLLPSGRPGIVATPCGVDGTEYRAKDSLATLRRRCPRRTAASRHRRRNPGRAGRKRYRFRHAKQSFVTWARWRSHKSPRTQVEAMPRPALDPRALQTHTGNNPESQEGRRGALRERPLPRKNAASVESWSDNRFSAGCGR